MNDTNIQNDYECNECRVLDSECIRLSEKCNHQAEQIAGLQKQNRSFYRANERLITENQRMKEEMQKARDHCSFGLYAEGSLVRKNNVKEALRLLDEILSTHPQKGQDDE